MIFVCILNIWLVSISSNFVYWLNAAKSTGQSWLNFSQWPPRLNEFPIPKLNVYSSEMKKKKCRHHAQNHFNVYSSFQERTWALLLLVKWIRFSLACVCAVFRYVNITNETYAWIEKQTAFWWIDSEDLTHFNFFTYQNFLNFPPSNRHHANERIYVVVTAKIQNIYLATSNFRLTRMHLRFDFDGQVKKNRLEVVLRRPIKFQKIVVFLAFHSRWVVENLLFFCIVIHFHLIFKKLPSGPAGRLTWHGHKTSAFSQLPKRRWKNQESRSANLHAQSPKKKPTENERENEEEQNNGMIKKIVLLKIYWIMFEAVP